MIITIAGDAGSGKSSAAKSVAQLLKYNHFSVGDFMRQIAQKRNVSVLELSKIAEESDDIDHELDDMQIELGKTEKHFVLDSRLGWHFVPQSFKVFLHCDIDEAAKRIFNDKRYGEDENTTLEETKKNIEMRKASELKRYEEYYKLNPYDKKHYDFIFDTSSKTIDETAEAIVAAYKKEHNQ